MTKGLHKQTYRMCTDHNRETAMGCVSQKHRNPKLIVAPLETIGSTINMGLRYLWEPQPWLVIVLDNATWSHYSNHLSILKINI